MIIDSKQPNPDDWGTTQPNNPLWPLAMTRLQTGQINKDILIHRSWQFAPDPPKKFLAMVTRGIMMKDFATLKYADLNDFEAQCQKEWKASAVRLSSRSMRLLLIILWIENGTTPFRQCVRFIFLVFAPLCHDNCSLYKFPCNKVLNKSEHSVARQSVSFDLECPLR